MVALARAQPGPVTQAAPFVVTESLLTGSPATVTHLELTGVPAATRTTPQLAARAANFFESTNDAHSFNDTYSLRGLTNTPIFGGPAISFYLDDIPLGSSFTFPTSLAGFARAELHRGPSQNTVFGRAGSAGVVTLHTPAPASSAAGDIAASFGNFNAVNVSASVRSPAGGTGDAYVSAAHGTRDGYVTNTTLHRDIDYKNSTSALARVRVRPAPTAELTLLVTALRARDGVQPLVPLGGPFFTVTRTAEGVTDLDAFNAGLTAAFATPAGRFTATTSLTDWDLGPYNSVLAFGPAELNNLVSQHQRDWNEELKLVSDSQAALRWQAGAFYSDGSTDGAFTRDFGPFTYEQSTFRIDSRAVAAFGEATFQAAENLRLTAGVRAEDSRRTMHRVESVPTPQVFNLHRESTALLPKLAAGYTIDRSTSLFASLGAGYKPGGFSAFTGNRALAAFGPERTKTLEVGATRASPNPHVSATVRAFWYAVTGYQIERSFATGAATGDDYLVVNAPRARSFGGELELEWKPAAGLTLAADLGTTDVTLREFRDPYTGTSYHGNRAPYVPAYDASLHIDYAPATGWFAGAGLTTNGTTYYTEAENPTFGQKPYALLGAHLGYGNGRYRLTLYGENLGDRRYYSAITPGTGHGTPGAPRTWGIDATVNW